MNPDLDVYLLFATTSNFVNLKQSKLTKTLEFYKNLRFRYFNIYEYSKGTILEDFVKNKKWDLSVHKLEHLSDIFRALTLYKYGGLYLDLDAIMLQPLEFFASQSNFFCMENSWGIASGLWHMDLKEGRKFTEKVLRSENCEIF